MFDFIWRWVARRAERTYDAGYSEAQEAFFSAEGEYERLRAFSLATKNRNSGAFFEGWMDGWFACRKETPEGDV